MAGHGIENEVGLPFLHIPASLSISWPAVTLLIKTASRLILCPQSRFRFQSWPDVTSLVKILKNDPSLISLMVSVDVKRTMFTYLHGTWVGHLWSCIPPIFLRRNYSSPGVSLPWEIKIAYACTERRIWYVEVTSDRDVTYNLSRRKDWQRKQVRIIGISVTDVSYARKLRIRYV